MKVERKLSDFFAEKRKWNENMETKTENLWNRNGNGNSLAEVETESEQRFPAKQLRKWKFPFPTNTEFPFYGCFA
jgi:hypothetical protein